MERFTKVLAAIMLITAMLFTVGCKKNKVESNGGGNGGGGSNDHAYVDLGLPSGLLWATCNIGADTPEGYGQYFAWGETQTKDLYNWSTYQHANGTFVALTKYCNDPNYGYQGYTDDLVTLQPEDDAAVVNWGNGWRMPTKDDWQELYDNTTEEWVTQNGVNGCLLTASNGNSIFLPAAGYYLTNTGLAAAGRYGLYWSSSLYTEETIRAHNFDFACDGYGPWDSARTGGNSVRPVRSGQN